MFTVLISIGADGAQQELHWELKYYQNLAQYFKALSTQFDKCVVIGNKDTQHYSTRPIYFAHHTPCRLSSGAGFK